MKTTFKTFLVENQEFYYLNGDWNAVQEKLNEWGYTGSWEMNEDDSVTLHDEFALTGLHMRRLPIKFKAAEDDFAVDHCGLISLEGFPANVNGDFSAAGNKLRSLKGGPSDANGTYIVDDNNLNDLQGAPTTVGKTFSVRNCGLESMKGGPVQVGENYIASQNHLHGFEGVARHVVGNLDLRDNAFTSLEGIADHVKEMGIYGRHEGFIEMNGNVIMKGGLGLIQIKGTPQFDIQFGNDVKKSDAIDEIINGHSMDGDIFSCQQALIDAGFEAYATL